MSAFQKPHQHHNGVLTSFTMWYEWHVNFIVGVLYKDHGETIFIFCTFFFFFKTTGTCSCLIGYITQCTSYEVQFILQYYTDRSPIRSCHWHCLIDLRLWQTLRPMLGICCHGNSSSLPMGLQREPPSSVKLVRCHGHC